MNKFLLLSCLLSGLSWGNAPDVLWPFIDPGVAPMVVSELAQTPEWADCTDDTSAEGIPAVEILCRIETDYYQTPVGMEVPVQGRQVSRIRLSTEFSAQRFSQLQLNLRRDGFQLVSLNIGGAGFNVREQTQSLGIVAANKAPILFINRNARLFPKSFRWAGPASDAVLTAEDGTISLSFTRH